MADSLNIYPLLGIGEITEGADLAVQLVRSASEAGGPGLRDADVLVITSKVVSKAEGRVVPAATLEDKARIIEAESVRTLRRRGDLQITETKHGFICANAGVDLSNVDDGHAVLLPEDPDRSARRLRADVRRLAGVVVAVVISDTFGRTWRRGVTDVAIGVAGIAGIVDLRGTRDANGRVLEATEVCVADELAGAADLVMGKATAVPAVVIRGASGAWLRDGSVRTEIVRPPAEDLFR